MLDKIPLREVVALVGDWNCRVGSRLPEEDALRSVLGIHGLGPRNSNGEQLITFAATNRLRIQNTFYMHDTDHKASWEHPR